MLVVIQNRTSFENGNTFKLREPPKICWYQVNIERCLWQRLELWYGNNPQNTIAFEEQLKWAIRSQVPKSVIDEDKEKVQRLNVSGLETVNPC